MDDIIFIMALLVLSTTTDSLPTKSHAPEAICDECCLNFNDCDNLYLDNNLIISYVKENATGKVRCTNQLTLAEKKFTTDLARKINSRLSDMRHFCGQKIYLTSIEGGAFAVLDSLTEVNLSNNKLTEIDGGTLSGLHRVRHLHVSDNRLQHVAQDAFERLPQLVCLDLHGNRLTQLTIRLSSKEIEWMDFSNNQLTVFSLEFINPTARLRRLSLQHNQLKTISVENVLVEELNLASNSICLTFLQEKWFEHLEYLALNGNGMHNFPFEAIEKFSKLTHIDLSQNNLTRLPLEQFSTLKNLEWIGLNDNHLVDLDVEKLPATVHLHVANNLFACSRLREMMQLENIYGAPPPANAHLTDNLFYYEVTINGIKCIDEDKIAAKDLYTLIQPLATSFQDPCSLKKHQQQEEYLNSKGNTSSSISYRRLIFCSWLIIFLRNSLIAAVLHANDGETNPT